MEIRVRVKAGARKEGVIPLPDGRLEISIKEKPRAGAANARVRELIAERYRIPLAQVRIIKGRTSPAKVLSLGRG